LAYPYGNSKAPSFPFKVWYPPPHRSRPCQAFCNSWKQTARVVVPIPLPFLSLHDSLLSILIPFFSCSLLRLLFAPTTPPVFFFVPLSLLILRLVSLHPRTSSLVLLYSLAPLLRYPIIFFIVLCFSSIFSFRPFPPHRSPTLVVPPPIFLRHFLSPLYQPFRFFPFLSFLSPS